MRKGKYQSEYIVRAESPLNNSITKKVSFIANDDSTTGEGMLKYAREMKQQRPMSPKKSPKKMRPSSPSKIAQLGYDHFSPEYHRAFAREVYYDEMVNIVRPTGKGSPKKQIKHGGMNLFTAKGQKGLRPNAKSTFLVDEAGNVGELPKSYTSALTQKWGVLQLGDDGTSIRDKDLREATEDVQRQFDDLMNEMVHHRAGNVGKIH